MFMMSSTMVNLTRLQCYLVVVIQPISERKKGANIFPLILDTLENKGLYCVKLYYVGLTNCGVDIENLLLMMQL